MSFHDNHSKKLTNTEPYSFFNFLSAALLFENPISVEKFQQILLRYNQAFERRAKGIDTEEKVLPFKYIELNDTEYKLVNGVTLETEIAESTTIFKHLFLQTKPIIYDFLYEEYFGKQNEKISPYGKAMRDIRANDSARQKPVLHDSLYRNHRDEEEIDLIRLAFYDVFGKDLKVIDTDFLGYNDSYLNLVQHFLKVIPSSNLNETLANSSGIWIGFSKDKFNNEKYTSFTYDNNFLDDQGFSGAYIEFCRLASKQIGGGDLNLVEQTSPNNVNLCHIEYQLRDLYSGPQAGPFREMKLLKANRFIQYVASRTRSGDSQLGYIHYFDDELLKQTLMEHEYSIVKDFIPSWNEYYKSFHTRHYGTELPLLDIGPRLSYIKKR